MIGRDATVEGNAWVYGDARVYGSARVSGDAWVYGSARVSGYGDLTHTRHYLTVGPIGSEHRYVTVHRDYAGPAAETWGHRVNAGCWSGTLDELAARIEPGGGNGWADGEANRYRAEYAALIALARIRVAEWEAEPVTAEDHARWVGRWSE